MQELIDKLISYISESGREEEVAKVKDEYFMETGGIFGEEDSFDMRMGTFFEWFILDRRIGGKTILEEYLDTLENDNSRAGFDLLNGSLRSIFRVTGVYEDRVNLKDLKDNKKYVASTPWGKAYLKNKNLLEVRLFRNNNDYIMSHSYILHPDSTKKFIVSLLKHAEEMDEIGNTINALAGMSLKWEKYRNFNIEDIYKQ